MEPQEYPIHIKCKKSDIAPSVLMPGDPLRAKYIAENFLSDYKLVNSVRGMYAYTGKYKGKDITVMAHGMGMPSMGIYCYELYKFYGVENIIRIGSCGAYSRDLKLFDIILSEKCYTEGNFALTMNNEDCHIVSSNNEINSILEETAKENNIEITKGDTVCTECFDAYMMDISKFFERFPKDFKPLGAEMECFALFYTAKVLNKKASSIISVVDSKYIDKIATPEERQVGLTNMIKLALESAIKI